MAVAKIAEVIVRVDEHERRITKVETCVDDLEDRHEALENVVIQSGVAIKVGTWIMAIFGLSVIAFIWSLITGQASILFNK